MRYRNLIVLAAGGLALLIVAVLLCAGKLSYFATEAPDGPASSGNMPATAYGPDEPAAGGLFVLHPGADTPTDWRDRLRGHGVAVGSPTGDGGSIIRVPKGAAFAPEALPGATLRAYTAAERLSGDLRTRVGGPATRVGKAAAGKNEQETVTVSLFEPADKQAVAALVRRLGGTVRRGLDEADAVALRVTLPVQGLAQLAAAPETVYIERYAPPEMLNDRASAVAGITPLAIPGFATGAGLTGSGQIVAVADSGLDTGNLGDLHPDLRSEPGKMPKVPYLRSWSGGSTADPIGHGTHMAATIAGTGAASNGKYRGAAPGASIYFQALLNSTGRLEPPPDLASLFRPAFAAGARIHVNGWGGPTNAYRGAPAQIDRFVRDNPDFLPIFGAGNAGPGKGTLTTEANSKNALVVGAAQNPRPAYGADSFRVGEPASFSSRGPTADGRVKPDLTVPGTAVISACSRSGPVGLAENPAYACLQGTSQAAALAGGAAAVLREYYVKEEKLPFVPAALLKAALINGARPLESGIEDTGFGLLDLSATVLALRTESFQYRDHREGIEEGEAVSFTHDLRAPGTTFRATLAWTDPAAAPGAGRSLVNDLDLVVRGPNGTVYSGNGGGAAKTRDNVNNVEQVTIENAAPGTYTVTVRGYRVTAPAVQDSTVAAQDFALVYGALPIREVVADNHNGILELADGGSVKIPSGTQVLSALDGRVSGNPGAGSDLYYFPQTPDPRLYLYAQTWQAAGVTTLSVGGQMVFTALDTGERDGGHMLDPQAAGALRINGARGDHTAPIPTGVELTAQVNPFTQNLWQVNLDYAERWGILAAVDAGAGTLRLLGDTTDRRAAHAVVAATDRTVDAGWADVPYGAAAPAGLAALLPGTSVHLVLSPRGDVVRYVEARRLITVGTVQGIDVGTIRLETGKQYRVFPGASVMRDRVESDMADLRPGDHISAVLMAESREMLSITAYSRVRYGQVVYRSGSSLHLLDTNNCFQTLRLDGDTAVSRWGLPEGPAVLAPGQWVRLTLDPCQALLWSIDIAETAAQDTGTVSAYHADEFTLRLTDGREYLLSPRALVTKNGHPIPPADLRAGETVDFTALAAPAPTEAVLTAVTAETRDGTATPELTVSALPLREYLFISGRTTADRIYLCRQDGCRESVAVTDGAFNVPVERRPDEEGLRVVAVNSADGGVNGADLAFPAGDAEHRSFTDIAGSWARVDIETLAARGLLAGYPDGTFRPQEPVSRGEFTALVVRVVGWPATASGDLPFADRDRIPAWLAPSVAVALNRDLVGGYPDDTFRPQALVTRVEAASMLVRALTDFYDTPDDAGWPAPPFADWGLVPAWAQVSVSRAYEAGFFRGRQDRLFAPQAPLTRAEVAVIIHRYLSTVGN